MTPEAFKDYAAQREAVIARIHAQADQLEAELDPPEQPPRFTPEQEEASRQFDQREMEAQERLNRLERIESGMEPPAEDYDPDDGYQGPRK